MYFYQVFVSDASFKGSEALTYNSPERIANGTIVTITLKNRTVNGFVVAETSKPAFKTKQIHAVQKDLILPKAARQLAEWLLGYYPSSVGITTQQLIPESLSLGHHKKHNYTVITGPVDKLEPLTSEQKNVIHAIKTPGAYLLHGETGSGKTRVYMQLTSQVLQQGRSALILTPEIGLTPQLANDFKRAFGEETVVVTHSRLTNKERGLAWLRIAGSERPLIVIGPRSALFSPLSNIGLIVLDESHEPSYKQEQLPRYQTVNVAGKLAAINKAVFLLGSGTPSVADYYLIQQKNRPILRMREQARRTNLQKPIIEIVDLKDRRQFTRSRHVSDQLLAAIEKSLLTHEQSLLFLNRRGTARSILCGKCGWQALCPHCNLPLTYHSDSYLLRCHTCGFKEQVLSFCPVCQNPDIILKSVGTKAIVDEITTIFPHARIKRFDSDNTKAERLEQHYAAVKAGDVDILIGTQVLAKGLDLPKLSTVGVVIADTGLCFPDFTAQERTYQLLRQVIGRVGRGHTDENSAIIQTYNPDDPVIVAAAKSNWEAYYENELMQRKKYLFPPFCFLLKLTCRRVSPASAERTAITLIKKIAAAKLHIAIDGPLPSFREQVGNQHQWQLVVKSKDRKELLKIIAMLPSGWAYDIDPLNLL